MAASGPAEAVAEQSQTHPYHVLGGGLAQRCASVFIFQRLCINSWLLICMIRTRPSLPVTAAHQLQHLRIGSASSCGRFAGNYSEPSRRAQESDGQSKGPYSQLPSASLVQARASVEDNGALLGRRARWQRAAVLGQPLVFAIGSTPRLTRVCSAL